MTIPGTATQNAPAVEPVGWRNKNFLKHLAGEILPNYLPSCRWFGRKSDLIREVAILQSVPLGEGNRVQLIVATVVFAEGSPESYTMVLALVDGAEAERVRRKSPRDVIATVGDDTILCDGLALDTARAALLGAIVSPSLAAKFESLLGTCSSSLKSAEVRKLGTNSRRLDADHSNSAIVYADRWFLKIYRKFEEGQNPDIALTQTLSEQHRLEFVPKFLGSLSLRRHKTQAGDIGLLVEKVDHLGNCWDFALDSLARYFRCAFQFARGHSSDMAADHIGPELAALARRLGQRTGQMHLALAASSDPDFAPDDFTPADLQSLHSGLLKSARETVRQLGSQSDRMTPSMRHEVDELKDCERELERRCRQSHDTHKCGQKIRVHGDFHLGQVLKTADDIVIIDFEGEPRRSLTERTRKRSPLVDAAGMLRSFDYAAASALGRVTESARRALVPVADGWVCAISEEFLRSYDQATREARFLPRDTEQRHRQLALFLLEKVIHEVGYELNYRPDFLPIPVRAFRRLVLS
jgi:maltose alpha-D-glucosyltransferase/alpha-amylase